VVAEDGTVTVPIRAQWGGFGAISHRWQSDLRDGDVIVNNRVVRATTNLEAMLRELQHLP
jgi:hypothetical protein